MPVWLASMRPVMGGGIEDLEDLEAAGGARARATWIPAGPQSTKRAAAACDCEENLFPFPPPPPPPSLSLAIALWTSTGSSPSPRSTWSAEI